MDINEACKKLNGAVEVLKVAYQECPDGPLEGLTTAALTTVESVYWELTEMSRLQELKAA